MIVLYSIILFACGASLGVVCYVAGYRRMAATSHRQQKAVLDRIYKRCKRENIPAPHGITSYEGRDCYFKGWMAGMAQLYEDVTGDMMD